MPPFDDDIGGYGNPICVSSGSSAAPSNDGASTISSLSSDMDLDRALRALRTNEARGGSGNAKAGPSRPRQQQQQSRSPRAPSKRRMVDETLVSGLDYSEPKRKVRQLARTPSQTTLASFLKPSPGSSNRTRSDSLAGPSGSGRAPLQRTPSANSFSNSRPASQADRRPPPSSRRKRLDGSSADKAINLDSDDSEPTSQPKAPRIRRGQIVQPQPRSRSLVRVLSGEAITTVSQSEQRGKAPSSQGDVWLLSSDDEPPPGRRYINAPDRQVLVAETVAPPIPGRVLVEETAPPRPRNIAPVPSQSSAVPDSFASHLSTNGADESQDRHSRQRSRARSATHEERQERQRRANIKTMTPAPSPPRPDILQGLLNTPTPKKPQLKVAPPPEQLNDAKRRLFAVNLDDESYRPKAGTSFARPIKPAKVAAYQANRPRRSVPERGKYALPTAATPIEEWPSRPGTSHTPQATKRKSVERHSKTPAPAMRRSKTPVTAERQLKVPTPTGSNVEAAEGRPQSPIQVEPKTTTTAPAGRTSGTPTSEEPETRTPARVPLSKPHTPPSVAAEPTTAPLGPSTPQSQRSCPLSSCLTPPLPSQLPAHTPLPAHSPLSPPGALPPVPEEPSPNVSQSGEREASPIAADPSAAGETREDAAGSATDHDDAGSDYGLDMYADFAKFAGSPSATSITNTPSKRSQGRLSLSPVAFKSLRSPLASRVGSAADADLSSSIGPRESEPQQSPSKTSQPSESLTARLQAEDQERQRKMDEEREQAQKAAAEREAKNRARLDALRLLESDESEEEEIRLSQVLRDWTPSPGLRRSTRRRQSVSKVSDDIADRSLPRHAKIKTNAKQTKLFNDLNKDIKRGTTTADIEAACSASASPERRPLDLANVSGIDNEVLEEARRIQREAERKEEQESFSVFWKDTRLGEERSVLPFQSAYEDPAAEMLEGVRDESTLAQLLSCLPVPASTEVLLNQWLLELAFCAADEELAYVALERLVEFIGSSTEEPVEGPDGLFWWLCSAWYQLGAAVEQSDRHLARVARDRTTASIFICRILSAAGKSGWLRAHCAWVMLCRLATLAGDSSTGATLSRQIEATSADLFNLVSKHGRHDNMIASELASLPLVPQVRSLLALGQRNSASRAAVRWATIGLLLPEDTEAIKAEGATRPSAHHMFQALDRIEGEIRSEEADFGRISNLLALWCAGLTDLDDGWANDPEAQLLLRDTLRVRDSVRENPDDPATSEVKGRLQLCHHIVHLHVQAATGRQQRARMAGKGLEVGERGQTRLSFGREESGESGNNETQA